MSKERRKGSLLGVLAYALVPGQRRVRAAAHFRKAGFEVLKGVGALMRPEGSGGAKETVRRERIEIQ
jgi:hypothetical protein